MREFPLRFQIMSTITKLLSFVNFDFLNTVHFFMSMTCVNHFLSQHKLSFCI